MAEPDNYKTRLLVIKTLHTIIYLVVVTAISYILYAGLVEKYDPVLWISLGVVGIEGIVFLASGMKCPLTTIAQRYGDPRGYVGDLIFSQKTSNLLFRTFEVALAIGLLILLSDMLRVR